MSQQSAPLRRLRILSMVEESHPCFPLACALVLLTQAYPEPRTQRQIEAWNATERALEALISGQ